MLCVASVPSCRSQNWCYSFFWCTLRLACLFSCSHLTWCRLESSYGTAVLLLLAVAMPLIIGLSFSCVLSLFSAMVTSALMFFSAELRPAPSFPSFSVNCPYSCDWLVCCSWSLDCLSGWPNHLVLLLEQLAPIWDRDDAADEVKQLAPVWSSKHRHTPHRDV